MSVLIHESIYRYTHSKHVVVSIRLVPVGFYAFASYCKTNGTKVVETNDG
jgi:hypothetical protein